MLGPSVEPEGSCTLNFEFFGKSGFNLKSIVSKKAKTKAAKDLRSRIKSSKGKIKTAGKGVKASTGSFDVDELDLDLGSWS